MYETFFYFSRFSVIFHLDLFFVQFYTVQKEIFGAMIVCSECQCSECKTKLDFDTWDSLIYDRWTIFWECVFQIKLISRIVDGVYEYFQVDGDKKLESSLNQTRHQRVVILLEIIFSKISQFNQVHL